jgi:hypothetical protein
VFVVLVAIGIGTAALIWIDEQRRSALDVHERDIAARVEGLTAAARDIAAYQAAYVALAQPLQPALDRVAANLQGLSAAVTILTSAIRSSNATSPVTDIHDDVTRLAEADRTIRDNLRAGETLMASDLIFGEARHTIDGIAISLRQVRDAESSWTSAERQRVDQEVWRATAAAAAVWLVGLLLLVHVPARKTATTGSAAMQAASPQPEVADASSLRLVPEPRESWPGAPGAQTPDASPASMPVTTATPTARSTSSVDLAAAADVCIAISRVTAVAALTDLLGRAAEVLDATGVIVWMGAGEELFPATAYGYDPRVVSRLGPIARFSDNATANAWVMGQLRTVAGDATTNGAIVAPMFGPDSCIGVLAAEVRHGREADAATQAVTMMIAAQLATAVVAWPAGSSAETKAG